MKNREYRERINRVINHIQDNLDTPLVTEDLAKIAFLSRSHFKKVFKQITGENISDYVKRSRLEKAQFLLLHNQNRAITDIALETGFSSSATFARVFKQYFGISASDFRKSNENGSLLKFGTPFLRNYIPDQYQGYDSVLSIADDGNGTYYFGSHHGEIYVYQNDSFSKIKFSGLSTIYSLCYDSVGNLWAGSVDDFGRVEKNSNGYKFISMKAYLKKEDCNFGHIWRIVDSGSGIYFQAWSVIFRWHQNRFITIKTSTSFGSITYINKKLYSLEYKNGLISIEGSKIIRENGSDQINSEHIAVTSFLPYDDENIFCATRNLGFWLYDGHKFTRFTTEVDHLLEEAGVLRAVYIPRLGYAIGTCTMGIIIIDRSGKLFSVINSRHGLSDNYIRSIHYSKDGMLLVGMMYGIAMLMAGLPVLIYNENTGVKNMISSIIRFRGSLYLATQFGIRREKHRIQIGEEIFQRMPDILSQTHYLLESNESLCIAYAFGLYIIRENGTQDFNFNSTIRWLCQSNVKPDTIYGSSNGIIFSFHYMSGQWYKGETIDGLKGILGDIVEDDSGRLFVKSSQGIVYRIAIKDKCVDEIIEFGYEQGVPSTTSGIYKVRGSVYLATDEGIFNYDESRNCFNQDCSLGRLFDNSIIHEIVEDGDHVWVIEGRSRNVYRINPDSQKKSSMKPVLSSPGLRAKTVYPEENGVVWIGCYNQLIRFSMKEQEKFSISMRSC